ncbi:MAG: hypothetical protein B7Y86_08800 [Brevundimonas subvibrioides]|uniref:Uncharacterized protein n=1 Tax=Brevundimonas subvibrioides TaxID=74313 RepID=A0A258HJS6_9CAUL|nr:hypothetical protein [Brevundimonas subvibrioides]OYX56844.1 MAG: hypothetical protein B7Y86_08800 [Brevundimonas subvibrioides]
MTDLTPIPPETDPIDNGSRGKTQRVSVEGTIASVSAISAMIVAAASMFTAVQALDVSRTAAKQKIFETQLATCLQFSELTARASSDSEKAAALTEGPIDDDVSAEITARLEAGDAVSTSIYQQYLQMTMVFPDEISDAAYAASEKRVALYNKQVEVLDAGVITAQDIADLERLAGEETDQLNTASSACRDEVGAVAGIG